MKNIGLYTWFTWLDARKVGVLTHIIILTGICLPILVLLGLKNGHIANIQEQIATSTSGRRILVRRTGKDGKFKDGFDSRTVEEFKNQYPEIDTIVPAFSVTLKLTSMDGTKEVQNVSIHPSSKGDPYLAANTRNADIFDDSIRTLKSIVLSSSVAQQLDVHEGDRIKGYLRRSLDCPDTEEIIFNIDKIIDIISEDTKEPSDEGYASADLMIAMLSYRKGNEVKLFPEEKYVSGKTVIKYAIDWPAKNSQPRDSYSGCFVFTPKSNPLNDQQKSALLESTDNYELLPVYNPNIATLYGMLKPEMMDKTDVYFKRIKDPKHQYNPDNPEDISWFTNQTVHGGMYPKFDKSISEYSHKLASSEGSIIYWNQRLKVNVNGKPTWLIGLTMVSNDRWLLRHAKNPDLFYSIDQSYEDDGVAYIVKGNINPDDDYVIVDIDDKCKLKLKVQKNVDKPADNDASSDSDENITQTTADESNSEENNETTPEPADTNPEAVTDESANPDGNNETTPEPADTNPEAVTDESANPDGNNETTPEPADANPEAENDENANPEGNNETTPEPSDTNPEAETDETTNPEGNNETAPEPADANPEAETDETTNPEGNNETAPEPADANTEAETEESANPEGNNETAPEPADANPEVGTDDSADPEGNNETAPEPVDEKSEIKTESDPMPVEDDNLSSEEATENILIVPAQLLSQIYDYLNGRATYAESINRFVENPTEPHFVGINVYAQNIRQVPELENKIRKDHVLFVESARDQINEMIGLESLLNGLIYFFALIMLGFGIFTVIVIIKDSTDRKRKEIGIMRVMGTSRAGIFYYVLLRSIIIAFGALVFTIAGAYAIKYLIVLIGNNQTDSISLVYPISDIIRVSVGAILCCCLGTLIPAYIASRIDPFEAVTREM